MKRTTDGRRVLTGQIDTGTYDASENKIHLFDGKFTTGYRIVEFVITPQTPTGSAEYISTLSTEPKSTISQWNWDDIQELAWGSYNTPIASRFGFQYEIRPENMVIEDLWINAYTTGEAALLNYMIVLDKYSFPSWDGAGILVENLSQGGPT